MELLQFTDSNNPGKKKKTHRGISGVLLAAKKYIIYWSPSNRRRSLANEIQQSRLSILWSAALITFLSQHHLPAVVVTSLWLCNPIRGGYKTCATAAFPVLCTLFNTTLESVYGKVFTTLRGERVREGSEETETETSSLESRISYRACTRWITANNVN